MSRAVGSLDTLAAGGKAALARALARIEAEPADPGVTGLLDAAFEAPRGLAIGLTGPPGVGKSTLVASLIRHWRGAGLGVGVIAVDPSSRASRGALLGDRTRLATDPEDRDLFVRSMAARDRLGGLAEITFPAMVLMRALFDRVIVETVGVGQSETEIGGLCDLTVLCAQPGSGDGLQFMKAGGMEIPDVVVVTKADLGDLARRAMADLKGALSLVTPPGRTPPAMLAVSAARGEGIADLAAALDGQADGDADARRARHAAQAARWAETHFAAVFGRTGLRLLGEEAGIGSAQRPFARASALSERLRTAIDRALAAS